jgi:cell wall assembly regulator SMI1
MVRQVADSWASIVGWLEEHLPTALEAVQAPAQWSAVSAVQMDIGRRLPSDLLSWLNLTNGFKHRGDFGSLLPTLHTPLPCERMLSRRALLCSISTDRARPGELEPAGSKSNEWLDSFLPISDTGTDLDLFVDLRDGDLYGCIGQFDAEAGGFGVSRWLSTADMLSDVADALTQGRPALQGYAERASTPWSRVFGHLPHVEEGQLFWASAKWSEQAT